MPLTIEAQHSLSHRDQSFTVSVMFPLTLEKKTRNLLEDDFAEIAQCKVYAECVCSAGNLVINPFDPNAPMQQWLITERKIQNRHDPDVVLEVSSSTRDVTTGELTGSALQLWTISYVYVGLLID